MQVQIPVSLYTSLLQRQSSSQGQQGCSGERAMKQPQRKNASVGLNFHQNLPIDLSALSAASCNAIPLPACDSSKNKSDFVEGLRFIREILRRSRTSFSTLQLALLYIVRLRNQLSTKGAKIAEKEGSSARTHASLCGRRMFLSALIVAAKYLQDRNYSNKAWAKISGLTLEEINQNEFEFLSIIDYDLYVSHKTYTTWSTMLLARTAQMHREAGAANNIGSSCLDSAAAASVAAAAASLNPLLLIATSSSVGACGSDASSYPPQSIPAVACVTVCPSAGAKTGRAIATPSFAKAFPSMASSTTTTGFSSAPSVPVFDLSAAPFASGFDFSAAGASSWNSSAFGQVATPPFESALSTSSVPSLVSTCSAVSLGPEEVSGLWGASNGNTYPSPSSSDVEPMSFLSRSISSMSSMSENGKRLLEEDEDEGYFGLESPAASEDESCRVKKIRLV
ncbi:hypothetical protein HDU97_006696 [Phlyctochytrium planicorne]|nr:hypothetical protein HDU97_006696 [Phlyctochytrium planicorne]